jgi:hypothetical protein
MCVFQNPDLSRLFIEIPIFQSSNLPIFQSYNPKNLRSLHPYVSFPESRSIGKRSESGLIQTII